MNEVLETIRSRRSIRKFKSEPVPEELIVQIAEAGSWAPSGSNKQTAIILAITNKELRDKIAKLNGQVAGREIDQFYGAPAVLIVLGDRNAKNHNYDGSLVMENMMLAAESLGLGSIWINRAKEVFDLPEGKEILKQLGIEGDYEGIGNCCIGYRDGEKPEPKPRKANYIYYVK